MFPSIILHFHRVLELPSRSFCFTYIVFSACSRRVLILPSHDLSLRPPAFSPCYSIAISCFLLHSTRVFALSYFSISCFLLHSTRDFALSYFAISWSFLHSSRVFALSQFCHVVVSSSLISCFVLVQVSLSCDLSFTHILFSPCHSFAMSWFCLHSARVPALL
jgi:hypothetical protein